MADLLDEKWLVEENAALALVDMCNFKVYASSIVVPPSDFQIIWLLFYDFVERRWTRLKRLR